MSYDFVFAGGRLKCFKIDLNVEAEAYNRVEKLTVQEAVFNVNDEKFAELKRIGLMDKDKIVIIIDIVGDKMMVEFFPE